MSEELDNLICAIVDATNLYDDLSMDEKDCYKRKLLKEAIELCEEVNKFAEKLRVIEEKVSKE